MNTSRDDAIRKDLWHPHPAKEQRLLWSMLLQSSQGSPASNFSPADDRDPTSRGLNPSAKHLKTEVVESEN